MRKLLFLAILAAFLPCQSKATGASIVQSCYNFLTNNNATCGPSSGTGIHQLGSLTSGNVVVIFGQAFGTIDTAHCVTDTAGLTITQLGSTFASTYFGAGSQNKACMACAPVTSSGSDTFTLTNNTNASAEVFVVEYSGLTCTLDSASGNPQAQIAQSSTFPNFSFATANANDLLIYVALIFTSDGSNFVSVGSGFTLQLTRSLGTCCGTGAYSTFWEDENVSSTGTYNATYTNTSPGTVHGTLGMYVALKLKATSAATSCVFVICQRADDEVHRGSGERHGRSPVSFRRPLPVVKSSSTMRTWTYGSNSSEFLAACGYPLSNWNYSRRHSRRQNSCALRRAS
jgi:hypothetical protein